MDATTKVNLSMVTQDSEDEEILDKEIGVSHILQGQEADDLGDDQSIHHIGGENYYEDGFHTSNRPSRDIVSADNWDVNHTGEEGRDGGHVSVTEEPLAGIEVEPTPNSNAHK